MVLDILRVVADVKARLLEGIASLGAQRRQLFAADLKNFGKVLLLRGSVCLIVLSPYRFLLMIVLEPYRSIFSTR